MEIILIREKSRMRMVESGGAKCFQAGWNVAAKSCDSCKIAAALLFCRTDSAFMCMACDVKLHNLATRRHERVWMCEVCEQAPASVTCKADAAALCVTCDRDIHSANPLARRHERVPVVSFYDTAESVVKTTAETLLVPAANEVSGTITNEDHDIGNCVAHNWSLPTTNTAKIPGDTQPDVKSIEFLFSDPDQLLDFDYPIPTDPRVHNHFLNSGTDSVVPVQPAKPQPQAQMIDHSPEARFEIDFTRSNVNSYNNSYNNHSLSHSVSSSSMDVGVVPEGSSMSDISYPFVLQMGSSVDLNGSTNGGQAAQLSGMDREARVLRYREKRKNRKFEKTIRYASRKAYAETRPRIKGRFAKRTDPTDVEVDHWLTSNVASKASFMGDADYGVVPSF